MDSVGYDLYVKLLNEAVLEERGERQIALPEAHIDLKVSAHIPEEYISSSAQRMEMYKKISLIMTEDDEMDVRDELCDRFGDPPRQVERLLEVALMKALAGRAGIPKIEARDDVIGFHINKLDLALWSEVFAKFPGMRFAPSGDRVIYKYKGEPTSVGCSVMRILCAENK
jgi:transcription-repair coupling factor (superfamily II helicase)